ncbi:histidine--tRNA ligase [Candidatus Woesearchaeota archaeon]|nr:histidine--tRNA ligase [Candidatus Woesearchaeota archaeon]
MTIQTLRGTKPYAPEEKILRNQIVETLRKIFEKYGFSPLETPILNQLESLTAKYAGGDEIVKEIYRLKDQGKRDLGLRYDLTVPLAQFIKENLNIKLPFKRYELGKVFRDGPIKTGRMREFWQCDADIIGTKSMLADAELLALAQEAFRALKLDITIRVNNRKLLNGLITASGITTDKESAILSIDKLAKYGEDAVKAELKEKGFTPKQIMTLMKNIEMKGSNKELLAKLTNIVTDDEGTQGIKEVEELLEYLKEFSTTVQLDACLARGLAYYTGTIFELFLKKGEVTSSLAAGGRWDGMIGKLVQREFPAVGISFGLEPISAALQQQAKKSLTIVYVIPIGTQKESINILQQLRSAGINADIDLLDRGPGKCLQYADTLSIPYALLIGEEEIKKKKVKLKDMKSGKEQLLTVKEVVKAITTK